MNKTYRVYIFGAGQAGQAALSYLKDQEVLGFLDNSSPHIGQKILGKNVYRPEIITEQSFDFVYIASEFFEQIKSQLMDKLSIPENKIRIVPAFGIKPFHFESNIDSRKISEKILGYICCKLDQVSALYYVDAGTLLGTFRDKELIPWDDDLDFALLDESLELVTREMTSILQGLEKITGCEWLANEYYSSFDYNSVKKGDIRSIKLTPFNRASLLPSIDLFIKYISGNTMDYVLASRGISMPSKHIRNTILYEFKAYKLRIPSDTEGYLEEHYGEDWRTPMKNWNLSMLNSATLIDE